MLKGTKQNLPITPRIRAQIQVFLPKSLIRKTKFKRNQNLFAAVFYPLSSAADFAPRLRNHSASSGNLFLRGASRGVRAFETMADFLTQRRRRRRKRIALTPALSREEARERENLIPIS
jgi:hypothetical protein